jgi:subtilase family serine protease
VNRLTCPRPDLIISNLTATQVTVRNQGTAAAGPFVVTVTGAGAFQVSGLAAGQSLVINLGGCFDGTRTGTADAQNQVAESNENNNSLTRDLGSCIT